MDKVTHQIRLDQWTKIVEECSSSNLTKLEWCRQNNISAKSYYYWQRKVRQQSAEAAALTAAPAFVELHDPLSMKHEQQTAPYGIASITPAAVLQKDDITVILSNSAEQPFIRALLGAMKND